VPSHAFSDPFTRLADATKARRLREAAAKALDEEAEQQPAQPYGGEEPAQPPSRIESSAGGSGTGKAAAVGEVDTWVTPAGLAKIDLELNTAYELAEDVNIIQLRRLLRTPVFASFLGFTPESPFTDRQVQLIQDFPIKTRREAAEMLGTLITKITDFDRQLAEEASAATASLSATTLTATVSDVRGVSQQFAKLYLADGCLVCPDQIKASSQSDFDNPNLRKLKEFEPRLLRRPDERNEAVARQLGFPEGELIGGY
jgi:hypothetical protein